MEIKTSDYRFIAAVGGVNVDIGARAEALLIPGDSNPGRIRMNPGGVCRNIAHNLALMGLKVEMLTVLGDDLYAGLIADSCAKLGIDLSHSVVIRDASTSTYSYIANPEGEMVLAVSDMEIYNQMTPQVLEPRLEWLNSAEAVVMDTNLTEETVCWICGHASVPVFADPVSTSKAVKLLPVLSKIHTLKPNRLEAELLSGVCITDENSLRHAAQKLLESGAPFHDAVRGARFAEPGSSFRYSNLGFGLLGMAVEDALGRVERHAVHHERRPREVGEHAPLRGDLRHRAGAVRRIRLEPPVLRVVEPDGVGDAHRVSPAGGPWRRSSRRRCPPRRSGRPRRRGPSPRRTRRGCKADGSVPPRPSPS